MIGLTNEFSSAHALLNYVYNFCTRDLKTAPVLFWLGRDEFCHFLREKAEGEPNEFQGIPVELNPAVTVDVKLPSGFLF